MTDTLYRQQAGGWIYNHGIYGYSTHSYGGDWGPTDRGEPKMTGINILHGDGAVSWKGKGAFDTYKMRRWKDKSLSFTIGLPLASGFDRSYW